MAQLSHPNVVPVYDVDQAGSAVFISMEYVAGQTLREWSRSERRPVSEILRVYSAAGRGLAAAHEAGVLHRDFKPANAILGEDGRVRVMDFGLARGLGGLEPIAPPQARSGSGSHHSLSDPLTEAGHVMGTPAYMAPEQFKRPGTDASTDQYAFCIALFEALYGKRPFAPRGRQGENQQGDGHSGGARRAAVAAANHRARPRAQSRESLAVDGCAARCARRRSAGASAAALVRGDGRCGPGGAGGVGIDGTAGASRALHRRPCATRQRMVRSAECRSGGSLRRREHSVRTVGGGAGLRAARCVCGDLGRRARRCVSSDRGPARAVGGATRCEDAMPREAQGRPCGVGHDPSPRPMPVSCSSRSPRWTGCPRSSHAPIPTTSRRRSGRPMTKATAKPSRRVAPGVGSGQGARAGGTLRRGARRRGCGDHRSRRDSTTRRWPWRLLSGGACCSSAPASTRSRSSSSRTAFFDARKTGQGRSARQGCPAPADRRRRPARAARRWPQVG